MKKCRQPGRRAIRPYDREREPGWNRGLAALWLAAQVGLSLKSKRRILIIGSPEERMAPMGDMLDEVFA